MPQLHHPAPAQRSHRRHEGRQADADGLWWPTTTWPWAGWSRRSARASSGRRRPSSCVEDDAQNGPDHVDAHRTVALVISPYTKRKHVDSTMYSTSSMLRTMELILGLKPMSQFDAAARPMYALVPGQAGPDALRARRPEVDLKEKNRRRRPGAAKLSEKFDLDEGGRGRRPAVQRGDLAFGEGAELADAAAGAGGVRLAAPGEEGQGRR